MPVHLFGQSCCPLIYDVAKLRKLKVLEDSCETILNPIRGAVSCHSTYMAHHVTTGVGGMAVTDDESLMMMIRSYANHGRSANYLPGFSKPRLPTKGILQSRFTFGHIGYSSRGTEFEAALGLAQLDGLGDNIFQRQRVASLLTKSLEPFSDFVLPKALRFHTFMMFPIVIKEDSKIDKYDLCLHLEQAGIETRNMMPITNQPCYKGLVLEDDFPVAKWINRNGFYVACNPGMTTGDVEWIRDVIDKFVN